MRYLITAYCRTFKLLGGGTIMIATPIEIEDPELILRRVGNVLIVVGAADIAWMIYVISSGSGYSSSFNIFAVIAGVLLRRNGLRTARIVRVFAAFMFAGFLGLLPVLLIIFPAELIQTYLQLTPVSQLLEWGAFLVAVLAMLWWVYRSLTAASVEKAIQAAELGRVRFWHHQKSGFIAGMCLIAILGILLPLSNRSESAQEAIERARAQLGPSYSYFVSSLSTSWTSRSGTYVRARVLAYTESSIEVVSLEWHE